MFFIVVNKSLLWFIVLIKINNFVKILIYQLFFF